MHGSGDGTATITSFQGHARTNDCDDEETLKNSWFFRISIRFKRSNSNTTTNIGILGQAESDDNSRGLQTMIGGQFTALVEIEIQEYKSMPDLAPNQFNGGAIDKPQW